MGRTEIKKIELILWDNDGVVSDSVPLVNDIRRHFYNSNYNQDIPEEICAGVNFDQEYDFLLKNGYGLSGLETKESFHENYKLICSKFFSEKKIPAVLGVEDVLYHLKYSFDVKNVIVSNANNEYALNCLRGNGMEKYFDTVLTAEDVENPKPDPEMLNKAMEMYGVEPSQCIFIDDTAHGGLAGINAGVETILFNSDEKEIEKAKKSGIDKNFTNMICLYKFLSCKAR